jgi:uncharacterized membrane protein YsdA (DUF1294 family)/cold shock CspA family protein
MRFQGRIARWNDDKGFGFIVPEQGRDDVFLHISALENRQQRPIVGDIVTFEMSYDERRRKRATNVSFAGEKHAPAIPSDRTFAWAISLCCFVFLIGAILLGKLPAAILVVYLVVSGVASLFYRHDKIASESGEWRTPEVFLLLLGLLGGWPGALVAQRTFRHKTRKASFAGPFWITVLLNIVALGWLLTPEGAKAIHSFLGFGG